MHTWTRALVALLVWTVTAIVFEPPSSSSGTQKAQWLITVGAEGSGHHGFCDSGYLLNLAERMSGEVVSNLQRSGTSFR